MTKRYWLSSHAMTVEVAVRNDPPTYNEVIVKAPPIVKKFIGQPLANLAQWMLEQGNFRMEELD